MSGCSRNGNKCILVPWERLVLIRNCIILWKCMLRLSLRLRSGPLELIDTGGLPSAEQLRQWAQSGRINRHGHTIGRLAFTLISINNVVNFSKEKAEVNFKT
jgi:hypothetical protein